MGRGRRAGQWGGEEGQVSREGRGQVSREGEEREV